MTTAIAPLPGFGESYSSLADLADTFDGWESVCGAEGSFEWFVARAKGRP